jgi:DNA-binding YbaB/EbfC family protein
MKNLGEMMKQAQKMQAQMTEMQERLAEMEIGGSAGGGMVTITMNGKGEARRLSIDPSLAKADEVEVLEDLVVAAINDAKAKVEQQVQEETAKVMGGLNLPPGLKLPF